MTLSTIIDLVLIAAIAVGGFAAWRLHQRLQAFRAMLPELKAEIGKLNASIAAAQDTLLRMKVQAVRADAPARREASRTLPPVGGKPEHRPRSALASLMAAMTKGAA